MQRMFFGTEKITRQMETREQRHAVYSFLLCYFSTLVSRLLCGTIQNCGVERFILQKHVFFPKHGHLKMQTYQRHVLDLERRVPASYY